MAGSYMFFLDTKTQCCNWLVGPIHASYRDTTGGFLNFMEKYISFKGERNLVMCTFYVAFG